MRTTVKPWEVRLLENGNMGNDSYFKDQEIANLRIRTTELEAECKEMLRIAAMYQQKWSDELALSRRPAAAFVTPDKAGSPCSQCGAIGGHLCEKSAAAEATLGGNAGHKTKIATTEDAREFLIAWMREHFPTDRTFSTYIREELAGDFAWQLATALSQCGKDSERLDEVFRDQYSHGAGVHFDPARLTF